MKPVNLRKTNRHFIDTETTGLDPNEHEILEITVLTETVDHDHPGRPGPVREWTRKIKPEHIEKAEPAALAINGYNEEEWAASVPFSEIAEELKRILADGVIIGHNCRFDVDFLQAAFKKAGVAVNLGHHFIDTVTLAYEHWGITGEVDRISLDPLRRHLGIQVATTHSSLKDAYDCRAVFYRAIRPAPREAFVRWVSALLERLSRFFGPFAV